MLDLQRIRRMVERRDNRYGTHYEGCVYDHPLCAVMALLDEIEGDE